MAYTSRRGLYRRGRSAGNGTPPCVDIFAPRSASGVSRFCPAAAASPVNDWSVVVSAGSRNQCNEHTGFECVLSSRSEAVPRLAAPTSLVTEVVRETSWFLYTETTSGCAATIRVQLAAALLSPIRLLRFLYVV
ncbi:hypothetical protein FGB62_69g08 [Gracilaria domingensis]|nr:hypothetical protein FGB62_69g08 [Gracilaria domingensis]